MQIAAYDALMSTANPRITITLTPELHAVLRRMAHLGGRSQSAIVGDMLQTSMPVFARVVKVMEEAERAQSALNDGIVDGFRRAQERIEGQLGLALDDFDQAAKPILAAAESVRRRSGIARSTPVPVTRGSGHPKQPKGKG